MPAHKIYEGGHTGLHEARRGLILRALKLVNGCSVCGYNKSASALHFHHRDPAEKEFNLGSRLCISQARVRAEIEKCNILCANCHAEGHHGE